MMIHDDKMYKRGAAKVRLKMQLGEQRVQKVKIYLGLQLVTWNKNERGVYFIVGCILLCL